MNISNIKIRKSVLFLMMMIIPTLRPEALALSTVMGGDVAKFLVKVLTFWNLLSIVFSLMLLLCCLSKRKKIQLHTWLIIALCLSMTISTIKMGSWNIKDIWKTFGNYIMISILASLFCGNKYIFFLQAWYYLITFWMVINSATIFIYFPNGMYHSGIDYNYYLFALDNVSFLISMIGFFIGYAYNLLKYGRLKLSFLLFYAFIALSYFYCKAGTGRAISICCVMVLLFYRINLFKILDYSKLLILMFGIFFVIVILRSVSWATWLLDLIGKDLTYNGRLDIWFAASYALKKSLLLGYGISTDIARKSIQMAGIGWISEIGHFHNIVFEFLVKGGMIGFFIFTLMLYLPRKKMSLCKNSSIVAGANFLFLLIWISFMFEYRLTLYSFWVVVFTFYNFKELIACKYIKGRIIWLRKKKWVIY